MVKLLKNYGVYILEFAFAIMFFGFAYFLLIVLQGVIMVKEIQYKKALVNFLYYQALHKRKSELQNVLFFEEETTDNWTLEQCQVQYVKDQLKYIEDGNFDEEIIETWNLVFNEQGE